MRPATVGLALALLVPAAAVASGSSDDQAALNVRSVEDGPCARGDDEAYTMVEVRVDGELVGLTREGGSMDLLPAPEEPVQVDVRAARSSGVWVGDIDTAPRYCDLAEGPQRNWTGSWDGSTTVFEVEGAGEDRARVELVLGPTPFALEGELADHDRTSAIVDWELPEDASIDPTLQDPATDQEIEKRFDSGPFAISGLCPGATAYLSAEIDAGPWHAAERRMDVATESPEPQAPHITQVSRDDRLIRVSFEPRAATIDTYEVHLGQGASFEPTDETGSLDLTVGYEDLARGNVGGIGSEVSHLRVVAVEGDQRNTTDAVEVDGFSRSEIDPPRPPCLDEGPFLEQAPPLEEEHAEDAEASREGSTPSDAGAREAGFPGALAGAASLLAVGLLAVRRRRGR